jgi:predicted phosphodiesterase
VNDRTISVLLFSDLHASKITRRGHNSPSYFEVGVAPRAGEPTPVQSLLGLTKANELQSDPLAADFLVCCGDLTHQAEADGFDAAWKFLHQVKKLTGARQIIATAGNHDVDSRSKSNPSPVDFIKSIKPPFPIQSTRQFEKYWSRNFFLQETEEVRFLVLNTTTTHGVGREHEWGRITDQTLREIREVLARSKPKRINICVCHHHPHRHSEIGLGDYDDIRGGQLFLDLLSEPSNAPWLILHGHKHHPRLSYAQGNARSPVVFSAGSFSARLYPALQARVRNQFYRLNFSISDIARLGTMVGTFESWAWYEASGWQRAPTATGLPDRGGFGYRDIISLAKRFSILPRGKIIGWEKLITRIPELVYLTPDDLGCLFHMLKGEGYSITTEPGQNRPAQLVRK